MKSFAWRGLSVLALVFASLAPVGASAAQDPTERLANDPRAVITAVVDTDEARTTPVEHRYIHGTILDDAKFQILLPRTWNGKVVIHTRGFSGTEFSTGAFLPAALAKGYAFAASDEGWNRVTIGNEPEDRYYESRQRLVELTVYMNRVVRQHYGTRSTRTLIMGGSNGGHHTKWMVEDFPQLFDGGIAGYGYNGNISQWGGVAQVVRNYDIIASRIDDIIARRAAEPNWDPFTQPLTPPLTGVQLVALKNIYDIPAKLKNGFAYNAGRVPGSEAILKQQYGNLVGYLRDSMTTLDPTFNPFGGDLLDEELGLWNANRSPGFVKRELRLLDLTGNLKRPVIIMHGTYDVTVSPRETEGYKELVERRLGRNAEKFLAVYYIPGMGHGGAEFNNLVDEQIDALEAWIDYHRSNGRIGSPAPAMIGQYPRVPPRESGLPPIPTARVR
ncbi:MAG TPA: tannase/feruloyl esterase family alpha/beta hydrolase [Caldimonas sp.]|jgi:pimeloyl-ACP methyl ester carboxylesterase|nr:tannase/feruloyl esterase family alpha/beta hydrolase [Caldimonas sp.]HEX2542436.1 tannase/feruloyl esterase family alpha/beta hydrolase [Caldimonas sp.]